MVKADGLAAGVVALVPGGAGLEEPVDGGPGEALGGALGRHLGAEGVEGEAVHNGDGGLEKKRMNFRVGSFFEWCQN